MARDLNAEQHEIFNLIQNTLSPAFKPIYQHLREESVLSKNHWIRYVGGQSH